MTSSLTLADPTDDTLPPSIFGDVHLDVPDGIPFETWQELGVRLQRFERSSPWWIGDWMAYGEHKWGEKFAQAIELSGLDASTLSNRQFTSERIPPASRLPVLSWTHHKIAADLPEIPQRSSALQRCAEEGWSTRKFATYVNGLKNKDSGNEDEEAPPADPKKHSTGSLSVTVPSAERKTIEMILNRLKEEIEAELDDRGIAASKITVSIS